MNDSPNICPQRQKPDLIVIPVPVSVHYGAGHPRSRPYFGQQRTWNATPLLDLTIAKPIPSRLSPTSRIRNALGSDRCSP